MKKIVFGVIVGILMSSTVFAASTIKSAYFNENIKLTVNGNATDVQFVTVELDGQANGSNYAPMAGILKALNDNAGINATYGYDSKTQTINVSVGQAVSANSVQQAKLSTLEKPAPPNEQLGSGMEWVWCEEGSFSGWCIKYNGCTYIHEIMMKELGYRTSIRSDAKGKFENYAYKTGSSKTITFNHSDTAQTISTNISRYVNLDWLKANL